MKLLTILSSENQKPLPKSLAILQTVLVAVLLLIPALLRVTTGEWLGSISAYAYSPDSNLFVTALSLGGAMFIYNATYTRKKYNFVLGASLIIVGLTPHLHLPLPHYIAAAIFFLGNAVSFYVFSSQKERPLKLLISMLVTLPLILHFGFGLISLLVAEWIGMLFIGGHVIAEGFNKID